MYTSYDRARAAISSCLSDALARVDGAISDDAPLFDIRIQRKRLLKRFEPEYSPDKYSVAIRDPSPYVKRPRLFKTKQSLNNEFDLEAIEDVFVELITKSKYMRAVFDAVRDNVAESTKVVRALTEATDVQRGVLEPGKSISGSVGINTSIQVKITDANRYDVVDWINRGIELGFFASKP
jgi:hypothetical protein